MTRLFVLVAALAFSATSVGPAGAAAPPYDGSWSVLIVTDAGRCDPAYRIPLKIEKGKVSYAGEGSFRVSGRVATGGAINVHIIYGQSTSAGAGRLAGRSGTGTWSGSGSGATCSGRWEAQRAS